MRMVGFLMMVALLLLSPAHAGQADSSKGSGGDANGLIRRAESEFAGKDCVQAVRDFSRAGAAALSTNPEAVLHYAECALKRGQESDVPGILKLLPPGDGDRHFAAGEMLVRYQGYGLAAAEFGLARQGYKDPYTAGYDQALAYYRAGQFSKSVAVANELLNQGHRTAELADLAGNAYLKNQQTQEAYNSFRLATGIDPNYEDGYVDLCSLALDLENFDLGVEIADVGLKHLPQSERIHLQRGVLRAMKGEFDRAQEDFAAAEKAEPGDVAPRISAGVLAMQTDHLDEAVEILNRAVTQTPSSYLAQYWYAVALLRSGATPDSDAGKQALTALKASVRLNGDFWHSQADLGKALLDRSEVESAIGHLEKAAALNPQATTPLYMLAQAYRRKGETGRAQELIARVSKMQAQDREGLAADLKRVVQDGTSAGANY